MKEKNCDKALFGFQLQTLFALFLMLLLAGCGGSGGGNNNPPSSPAGVVISAGDSANTLQWNAATGATSYNIYWSTTNGSGMSGTKIADVSSPYTHTALTNGTTYYYVITAENSIGESAASIETSGTPSIPPPDAPSFQNVTPGDQQNTLSWNPVDGATSYNLYWSTSSGSAAAGTQITNVTSPYQHTGLTNGTPYYYVITAVGTAGESSPSTEVGSTPLVPPYATQQYPYSLGSAPLSGHEEALPNESRFFHYTLAAEPDSVFMFNLDNIVIGARLEVFRDNSWDDTGYGLACSDYSYSNPKNRLQCIATAPASGLFYVRIASTSNYAENATLSVDKVVNQGSAGTPVYLGSAPTSPYFGTVLEGGESIYQVDVTPGNAYRVMLTDWEDSGASLSKLNLKVYDGVYSDPNWLSGDYGGNSSVDHQHRIPIIHCLAKPATNSLIIVTNEMIYGVGATYNIVVENAVLGGSQSSPTNVAGNTFVYHGEVTADPALFDYGYSYYELSVTPNTDYLVDLRGMHERLDLVMAADSGFTSTICSSRESNLIDESCTVNSGPGGVFYALVETKDRYVTDTFILSAIPVPAGAVAPARYPNEGTDAAPIDIGPGLPITGRLSTVGAGTSYYSVSVTPGSTMKVSSTVMNADVDILVYSDAEYLNYLCASRNYNTTDDSCTFTVPDGISTIYILAEGQYTTNNGSWSANTERAVGAAFRLTVETI